MFSIHLIASSPALSVAVNSVNILLKPQALETYIKFGVYLISNISMLESVIMSPSNLRFVSFSRKYLVIVSSPSLPIISGSEIELEFSLNSSVASEVDSGKVITPVSSVT